MAEFKSSRLDELNKLKAKDLKAILQLRRVDCSACVEKSDFVDLVLKTDSSAAASSTEQSTKGGITSAVRTIGGLNCTVIQNAPSDFEAIVFVFHGYGASMDNLSPIGSEILRTLPNTRVKFVFPNAPIELQAGSFAWWPLDMQSMFMKMIQEGVHAVFKGPEHPKVEHARRLAASLIDSVLLESQAPYSKVILAGFSQGSWLATDLALSAATSPAALAIFSGGLVFEERWLAQMANRKGLKVLQSHGTKDMLLPIALGHQLRDSLKKGGLEVDFMEFDADHTIPESAIVKFGALIKNVAGGK